MTTETAEQNPIEAIREHAREIGYTIDPRTAQGFRIGGPIHHSGEFWNISASYGKPHSPSVTSVGSDKFTFSINVCLGNGFGGLLAWETKTTNRRAFVGEIPAAEFVEECKRLLTETMRDAESIARRKLNTLHPKLRESYAPATT